MSITSLLKWIFTWLKPTFKRYVYRKPTVVELYMGTPGSLSFEITKSVIEYCEDLKFIQIVPFSDTLNPATKIWVNDETHGTCGLLAVCRYLGRLTELHPSTPENALVVDGSLGLLQSCIDTLEKNTQYDCVGDKTGEVMHDTLKKNDTVETSKALQEKENENAIENEVRRNVSETSELVELYLSQLEESLEIAHGYWMMDMTNVSLADVCWFGTMKWLSAKNILPSSTVLTDEYPHLSEWLRRMKSDEETFGEHKSK
jgi:hypothetical protein